MTDPSALREVPLARQGPQPEWVLPRAMCDRCRRPCSVCYCAHLTPLPTRTRIVLLQHPRERDVAIGTARMASLCLPNSELHVGVHWDRSPAVLAALSNPERPAALLYPGEGAMDVLAHPPPHPITLVVVDGTWSQTKKVVRENPILKRLPRYAFTPQIPSEYRIRREPTETCVSTIEALVFVLSALEPDGSRFEELRRPFRAMIDAQIECEQRFHGGRLRHRKTPRKTGPRPPPCFTDSTSDLLCVVGEANAWPYRNGARETAYPDELVHWVAHRVATGDTFEFVMAPCQPLGPKTCAHIGLPQETLAQGGTGEKLARAWGEFVRPNDVLCSWGHYAPALFAKTGLALPEQRVDVRQVARNIAAGKVGTVEEFALRIGAPSGQPLAAGRAGLRLQNLLEIVRHLQRGAHT